jgi:uncharacterized protein (DUF736 family)
MNIGEFKNVDGQFLGSIATLAIDLPKLGLRPVQSPSERAPAFEIVALNAGRRWVQMGALWEATANETGEAFYQGKLEDPALSEPLYIALFGNSDEGYRVAWNRPKRRDEFGSRRSSRSDRSSFGESTAGADGGLAGAGVGDDHVPF